MISTFKYSFLKKQKHFVYFQFSGFFFYCMHHTHAHTLLGHFVGVKLLNHKVAATIDQSHISV